MRKSRAETAETRQRIVEVAAREFRANGIHAMGLNDVMEKSGLTRGGFYRHFNSKEHLVAQACSLAVDGVVGRLDEAARAAQQGEGWRAIVERYLSESHRDHADHGCPFAAMGSELARGDHSTRAAASQGIHDFVDMLAQRLDRDDVDPARSDAMFALAAMIGGMTLSRIMVDNESSESVLQSVRDHLDAL